MDGAEGGEALGELMRAWCTDHPRSPPSSPEFRRPPVSGSAPPVESTVPVNTNTNKKKDQNVNVLIPRFSFLDMAATQIRIRVRSKM